MKTYTAILYTDGDYAEHQIKARSPATAFWSEGDLAAAVRSLDASLEPARTAIAKAKPPTA